MNELTIELLMAEFDNGDQWTIHPDRRVEIKQRYDRYRRPQHNRPPTSWLYQGEHNSFVSPRLLTERQVVEHYKCIPLFE